MADVPLPLSGRRAGRTRGSAAALRVRRAVVIVYSAGLVVLAVIPNPVPRVAPELSDAAQHAVGYGVLALLVAWSFASTASVAGRVILGLAWGTGLGVATELLQGAVPWRSAELRDVGWDLVGAAAGALLWLGLSWLLARRRRERP